MVSNREVRVQLTRRACELLESVESRVASVLESPEAWTDVDNLLTTSEPGVYADPDKRTKYTALQLAAKYGRLNVVSNLLTRAEFVKIIQEENERGESALHLAAKGGHHEIVRKLIQCCEPSSLGAFVNYKSHYYRSEPYEERVSEAVAKGRSRFSIVRILLFSCWKQSIEKNVDKAALHYASAGGHVETVKYLLSIPQVDVGLQDREGNTALHLAMSQHMKNGVDGTDVLKELLASLKIDVNLQGSLGDTALHKAVREENLDGIELLSMQRRLIATRRNKDGRTPLRLAWELQKKKKSNQVLLEIAKNTLLDRADVRRLDEKLQSEREILYMAVNALLVGGTLLASVSFGGKASLLSEESFYYFFRAFNNSCFFLAVITLMMAIQIQVFRRNKVNMYVEEEVEHLGTSTVLLSFCLTVSTFCAVIAFVTYGAEGGYIPFNLMGGIVLTILLVILIYTFFMAYFFPYQKSKKLSLRSFVILLLLLLMLSAVPAGLYW